MLAIFLVVITGYTDAGFVSYSHHKYSDLIVCAEQAVQKEKLLAKFGVVRAYCQDEADGPNYIDDYFSNGGVHVTILGR
jgi:L-arabinose isomerase